MVICSLKGLTWMHHHDNHCETGELHACQNVSSRLSCHKESGETGMGKS